MKNILFSLIAVLSLFLFSCEKENAEIDSSIEDAIVLNDAAIEAALESSSYEVDLFTNSSSSIDATSGTTKSEDKGGFRGRYRFGKAPNVTVETTDGGFPKTITLNYGESTELQNGRIISGSIIIVVSDRPRTVGTTRNVSFSEFYVDSINIAGTRTITFDSNEDNNLTYTSVAAIVITLPDGVTYERNSEKVRTFVEGFDTAGEHADDIFNITGFVNTVCSEGYSFSRNIIEPLVKKGDCKFIVSGIVTISKNDVVIAELNYGDGECDDIAIVTKGGEEKQITLGKRYKHQKNN